MAINILSSPFGSATRTRILVALRLLGSSHPRELSRLLAVSPSLILKALRSLERDGLVAGRTVGRSRPYTVDPRYFAKEDLQGYLLRLSEADPVLKRGVAKLRRRPRWSGKPV